MLTVKPVHPNQTLQHLIQDRNISPREKITRLCGLYGISQKDLAKQLGRHPGYVNEVLSKKRESEVLKRDIAAFFSLKITDIWPETQA